jgi:hypothetical protein
VEDKTLSQMKNFLVTDFVKMLITDKNNTIYEKACKREALFRSEDLFGTQ